MNTATFSDICKILGAPLRNTRWSWCALSPNGKRAIFTLWQDKFEGRRYPILYHDDRDLNRNPERAGCVEIRNVVQHCLTHSTTETLGVLAKVRRPGHDPRVREWVDSRELLVLKISVDQEGNPWAEIVGRKSLVDHVVLHTWLVGSL